MAGEGQNPSIEEGLKVDARAADVVERTMEHLIGRADVNQVYGEPIRQDETTILPAAEVVVGAGFGIGSGFGFSPNKKNPEDTETGGTAGGGGGSSSARPVAVIIASPEGVRVEPVVDFTKIGLALITAWGFMLSQIIKMRKG